MSLSNSSGLQYFYISLSNIIYSEFKADFFDDDILLSRQQERKGS